MQKFEHSQAFARNIGWLTLLEQDKLKSIRVAIAGLGGVGCNHLITLTRLGVTKFSIADFDTFSIQNMNRQAGAFMSTLGRPKIEVAAALAKDINPDLDIRLFPEGVTPENLDSFLDEVSVYIDGLDFFVLPVRRAVFGACHAKKIHAITAAPLGMGAALLYFSPEKYSFEDYFKLEGHSEEDQYARFIAGLSPGMLSRKYLVEASAVNFKEKRGPSTIMACEMCASLTASTLLKVVLNRGPVRAAPWGLQVDGYSQKLKHTWRPWGNNNPLQRILISLIRPMLRGGQPKPKS